MKNKYASTLVACYIGYMVQAIVNNLTPLLFAQFGTEFSFSASEIAIIIAVNFTVQILVDTLSAGIALKIGYRRSAVAAHLFSVVGLILLGVLPNSGMSPFAGILIATVFTAIGGGFIEVVISPLVEALPLGNKSGAMSFLHSFYCWGHIFVVLFATAYFSIFGIASWKFLPIVLCIIPAINAILLSKCPFETLSGDENPVPYRKIFAFKGFFIFIIIMLCAGAAELAVAQWASYFAEITLKIENKAVGDLLGTCLFALGMALSRTVYGFFGDRLNLKAIILLSAALLCGAYLLIALSPVPYLSLVGVALGGAFVGMMWPGTYSIAGKTYKNGGTKMFGMLALAGDIGCLTGPALVGLISEDIRTGLLVSTVFPAVLFVGMLALTITKIGNGQKEE